MAEEVWNFNQSSDNFGLKSLQIIEFIVKLENQNAPTENFRLYLKKKIESWVLWLTFEGLLIICNIYIHFKSMSHFKIGHWTLEEF
jgi:hypothetical protein